MGWGGVSFRFHFVSLIIAYYNQRNKDNERPFSLVLITFIIPKPSFVKIKYITIVYYVISGELRAKKVVLSAKTIFDSNLQVRLVVIEQ